MSGADQRFGPKDRLCSPAEYKHVLKQKCSVRGQWLILFGSVNGLGRTRLGRVVSKRWGKAHVRNRYRRWLREAFRVAKGELAVGMDIVVMPHRIEGMTFQTIVGELRELVRRLAERIHSSP